MRKIIFTILFIFCAAISFAQVKGRVVDQNSMPLEGAVLMIVNRSDSTLVCSGVSGPDGCFDLKTDVVKGNVLTVSYLGYSPVTVDLKNDVGDLKLAESNVRMNDVVVKGAAIKYSSDRITFSVSNPEILKVNDATGILKLTPLLNISESGLSVLGSGEAKVYLNKKELRLSGDVLISYLKGIPAEEIINIEVMPVANNTYKGKGDFSIVNITLRKPENEGIKGFLNVTDMQSNLNSPSATLSLTFSKKKVSGNVMFYGNMQNIKYHSYNNTSFNYDMNFADNRNTFTGKAYNPGVNLAIDYNINDKHTLGFEVSGYYRNRNYSNNSLSHYYKENSTDSVYNTTLKQTVDCVYFTGDINYLFKTDNNGSNLFVDVNYLKYNDNYRYKTDFEKKSGETTLDKYTVNAHNPVILNVLSGQIGYTHIFKKFGRLYVGLDNYTTLSKNSYFDDDQSFENSNVFIYDESVSGFYASYTNNWTKKFSTRVGVRMEDIY